MMIKHGKYTRQICRPIKAHITDNEFAVEFLISILPQNINALVKMKTLFRSLEYSMRLKYNINQLKTLKIISFFCRRFFIKNEFPFDKLI